MHYVLCIMWVPLWRLRRHNPGRVATTTTTTATTTTTTTTTTAAATTTTTISFFCF